MEKYYYINTNTTTEYTIRFSYFNSALFIEQLKAYKFINWLE